MTTINSLNPLKSYIGALIENLDKEKIPKNIDLILDSGAFNGAFGCGILVYLQELEKLKLLKIDKISGTSIGAILAVMYLTDKIESCLELFENLLNTFRETMFLDKLSDILHELVNTYVSNIEDMNDKLFITYYDIITMKQVVVSKYNSKEELIEILKRASYIPYITDGKLQYKENYSDGVTPYIFPKSNKKVLFICFISYKKFTSALFTKNEVNIWSRLLNGVIDINNFFSGSRADFCSYVNNWAIYDFALLRIREIIVVILYFLLKSYLFINEKLPEGVRYNIYLSRFSEILSALYKDIFSYMIL